MRLLHLVFVWGGAQRGGGLIAVSRGFSASVGGVFMLAGEAGRWAIIPWGWDTFLMFPYMLRS